MRIQAQSSQGIVKLVRKYRNEFHISENINYYSPFDFQKAEKKYIKFRMNKGTALHHAHER